MSTYRLCLLALLPLPVLTMSGVASEPGAGEGAPGAAESDPWDVFRFLVGSWEGTGEGNYGTSRIEVHGEFILGGKYLFIRSKAVFEPQEKNPKGEIHEDWAFVSYDKAREKFVMRQFNVEGFVNRYVLDSISENPKRIVLTTEAVENGPPGLRARETFTLTPDGELNTVFELAFAGKDFSVCGKNRLKRKN